MAEGETFPISGEAASIPLQLTAEDQSFLRLIIIERFDTGRIAGQIEGTVLPIQEGEDVHTSEPFDKFNSESAKTDEEHFTITLALETLP